MTAREYLRHKIEEENDLNYGVRDQDYLEEIVDAWMDDKNNSKHRFNDIYALMPDARLILDMASGCGTCVFYGLMNGYDMHGIDPEGWKHRFNIMKAKEFGYPNEWIERLHVGVGERLPFEDDYFDYVTSYQTLEHVQNPLRVISEMVRVTRPGGAIQISCPDYRGTFEPHYRLPWIPLIPKPLARLFLGLAGRPVVGLDELNYITKPGVIKWIQDIEEARGCRLSITDLARDSLERKANDYGFPSSHGYVFVLYQIYIVLRCIARRELSLNILIRVEEKHIAT